MPDDLYHRDIVLWSQHQASLLRRLAAGERLNEIVDWSNLIEEIEALGRSETRACRSLLAQAVTHLVKQAAWPEHRAAAHWRSETIALLAEAQHAWSASMRQLINWETLYATARRSALALAGEFGPPRTTSGTAPFGIDAQLVETPDLDALLERLVT